METLKTLFFLAILMIYFKVAFALGFGFLWSGGALILLALVWWGMKALIRTMTGKEDQEA